MDDNVLAAMARWPDVPDVYGWLSLSESGHWRLHPQGDAVSPDAIQTATLGEGISNPQILRFINQNYAHDDKKRWFFQNGPQKVYVRLDAAPYILHTEAASLSSPSGLITHNGLTVSEVRGWYLDNTGKLYAQTELGAGLVAGRDLAALLETLYTHEGSALLSILEREPDRTAPLDTQPLTMSPNDSAMPLKSTFRVPFHFAQTADIPRLLDFIRHPMPPK